MRSIYISYHRLDRRYKIKRQKKKRKIENERSIIVAERKKNRNEVRKANDQI